MQNLEMRYPLAVAVEMIPMPNITALYRFLHKHSDVFERRYRRMRGVATQRFLTVREIQQIQRMLEEGVTHPRVGVMTGRPRRARASASKHPLAHIMEAARG